MTKTIAIADLKPGDMIDLAGDIFADPDRADPYLECEYVVVDSVERETPDCIRVDFEDGPSIGFPPNHQVPYGGPKYEAAP